MNRTWEEKRGGGDARAAGVFVPHQAADGVPVPPGSAVRAVFPRFPSISLEFDFPRVPNDFAGFFMGFQRFPLILK